MMHAGSHRAAGARGFTLLESIIVLLLMGIAAAAIISLQGSIFHGKSDNKTLEIGAQLMQECAEQVLATRRLSGYANVNTSTCNISTITANVPGGFGAPSVTVTSDDGGAACPVNSNCKQVQIFVSTAGVTLTPITLELVNY